MFLQPEFKSERKGKIYISEVEWKQENLVTCLLDNVNPVPVAVKVLAVTSCGSWENRDLEGLLKEGLEEEVTKRGVDVSSVADYCVEECYRWEGGAGILLVAKLYRCGSGEVLQKCTASLKVRR